MLTSNPFIARLAAAGRATDDMLVCETARVKSAALIELPEARAVNFLERAWSAAIALRTYAQKREGILQKSEPLLDD